MSEKISLDSSESETNLDYHSRSLPDKGQNQLPTGLTEIGANCFMN